MAAEQAHQDLRTELAIHERRLAALNRQMAHFGAGADPSIMMEATDLRTKINEIQEKLEPPRGIPVDIWYSMSADDQRRYQIKLVMELQADFIGCRFKLNRDVKLLCAILIVVQVLSTALLIGLRFL